jgi:S1-C subfamily serine protease
MGIIIMFTRIYTAAIAFLALASCIACDSNSRKEVVLEDKKPAAVASVFDARNVYVKNKNSIVSIWGKYYGEFVFFGTGFSIKSDIGEDVIITAAHVVDYDTEYMIKTIDGKEYKNVNIWMAERNDVAILTPSDENEWDVPKISLHKYNQPIGTKTYVIGHPAFYDKVRFYVLSDGLINQYIDEPGLVTSPDWTGDIMGISNDIHPGNSGSPVLDERGRVIGIAVSGHVNEEHQNYAVPVEIIKEEIENYMSEKGSNTFLELMLS